MISDVLVVGSSAAGLGVAEALRRNDFHGTVTFLGAERHQPYDRPPLSKQVLSGAWPAQRAALRTAGDLDALKADWVLGRRATALDRARRIVAVDDGTELAYRTLVVATGLTPRQLPAQPHLAGMHTLHTLEDSAALRHELVPGRRVVVVGAGVLGCEVGATARGSVASSRWSTHFLGPCTGNSEAPWGNSSRPCTGDMVFRSVPEPMCKGCFRRAGGSSG